MASQDKPELIQTRKRDGTPLTICVPKSRIDVEQQPDIPAHALALLAFSKKVNGVRRWSEFTALTLKRLSDQYGDSALRLTLAGLLDDMAAGFRPVNPVGVYIHRVRATATTDELKL